LTLGQHLASAWDLEPSVILGCAALMIVYLRAAGLRFFKQAVLFAAGVLVLLLTLVSPLDTLADHYLFSAHMLQHLFLILVVPPLLLLGIPESLARKMLQRPFVRRCENLLGRPAIAWPLGIGTFWGWHAPLLYNAALANEPLHIVEHLSFLVTSAIFWWPVLAPVVNKRLSPPMALVYLLAAGLSNTLLGIILVFSPGILYTAYVHPSDPLGILHLIRDEWNLSARSDQTLGGLLMWIPGSLVYLGVILATLLRWFTPPAAEPPFLSDTKRCQTVGTVKRLPQTTSRALRVNRSL
jgi:cytochrome c oxidase assembly factor CtaG